MSQKTGSVFFTEKFEIVLIAYNSIKYTFGILSYSSERALPGGSEESLVCGPICSVKLVISP